MNNENEAKPKYHSDANHLCQYKLLMSQKYEKTWKQEKNTIYIYFRCKIKMNTHQDCKLNKKIK